MAKNKNNDKNKNANVASASPVLSKTRTATVSASDLALAVFGAQSDDGARATLASLLAKRGGVAFSDLAIVGCKATLAVAPDMLARFETALADVMPDSAESTGQRGRSLLLVGQSRDIMIGQSSHKEERNGQIVEVLNHPSVKVTLPGANKGAHAVCTRTGERTFTITF